MLNATFRPERLAGIIAQAADTIAPEIERHFRRWGRAHTQAQWQDAVHSALIQYTATRHTLSWNHLDSRFGLGGTGTLTVRNNEAGGTGGRFTVNGIVIDTSTEGVTSRAVWTGTFFRNRAVPVQAVPDAGYVFDGWVGTAIASPNLNLFVGETPLTLVGRFRLRSGDGSDRLRKMAGRELQRTGDSGRHGCGAERSFRLREYEQFRAVRLWHESQRRPDR